MRGGTASIRGLEGRSMKEHLSSDKNKEPAMQTLGERNIPDSGRASLKALMG